jgi:hypothetical protein
MVEPAVTLPLASRTRAKLRRRLHGGSVRWAHDMLADPLLHLSFTNHVPSARRSGRGRCSHPRTGIYIVKPSGWKVASTITLSRLAMVLSRSIIRSPAKITANVEGSGKPDRIRWGQCSPDKAGAAEPKRNVLDSARRSVEIACGWRLADPLGWTLPGETMQKQDESALFLNRLKDAAAKNPSSAILQNMVGEQL